MSECLNKYFLYNEDIRECKDFNDDKINNGKSIYEVIRIIQGKPLFLQRHLGRLENSAKITDLNLWLDHKEIQERIYKLIKINNISFGNIKFIFNFNDSNTFLAYFVEHHYPEEEDYIKGVPTILYHGERENPNAKVINKSFRDGVNKEIKDKKAFEAILVDRNGYITEGSKSNIFMVKDKKVFTAPLQGVLPGTTREVIIEVCKKLGIEVIEQRIHYKAVKDLDALFISGTSPKVLPIRKVDEIEFNSSKDELVLCIMREYQRAVDEDINRVLGFR